jgi:hypothetical protein
MLNHSAPVVSQMAFITLRIVFSVTCCLELRNALYVYHISHVLLTNVKLVVWTL